MIVLKTARLIIRDHKQEDLLPLHELLSNAEVMFFLPEIKTNSPAESEKNLSTAIHEAGLGMKRTKYFFAIFLHNDQYAGEIGYTVFSHNNYKEKNVHLGYFIKQQYWNQGFSTEAVKKVIEFAFLYNHVIKIETGCLADNGASEKVMLKCGFQKEACKRNHQFLSGKWRDRLEYGLLKEEYRIC